MKKKADLLTISSFCNDMGVMLSAGMTTEEALEMLAADTRDQLPAGVLRRMEGLAREGARLSGAMQAVEAFPAYAVQLIAAGEAAGRIEESLGSLAEYYARQHRLRRLVGNAMIQPLILLGILGLVMALFLWQVLPAFGAVYRQLGGGEAAYIGLAYWLGGTLLGLVALALVGIVFCWGCVRTGRCQGLMRGLWHRALPTRAAAKLLAEAQLVNLFSTRLAGGMVPDEALAEAARSAAHPAVAAAAARSVARMAAGESMGIVFYEEQLLPPRYTRMIYSGVRAGRQEAALEQVAEGIFAESLAAVDAVVRGVEPVLTGVFTLAMAGSLLSVMLPLIGILTAMG